MWEEKKNNGTIRQNKKKINALLQQAAGRPVNFREMADTLCGVIEANVFIVSRRGKLLGHAIHQHIESDRMKQMLAERQFPEEYTKKASSILQKHLQTWMFTANTLLFPVENKDLFQDGLTTIVPIVGGGERLGTLELARLAKEFSDEDLILAEYGATVVAMEIFTRKKSRGN
ncbi:hypothetical protein GCM10020331_048060 [Ectobacillus funiculus]